GARLRRTGRGARPPGRPGGVRPRDSRLACPARAAIAHGGAGEGHGPDLPLARGQRAAARLLRAGDRGALPHGELRLRCRAAVKLLDITEFYSLQGGGVRTYLAEKARWVAAHGDVEHAVIVPSDRDAVTQWERSRVYLVRGPRVPASPGYHFLLAGRKVATRARREPRQSRRARRAPNGRRAARSEHRDVPSGTP